LLARYMEEHRTGESHGRVHAQGAPPYSDWPTHAATGSPAACPCSPEASSAIPWNSGTATGECGYGVGSLPTSKTAVPPSVIVMVMSPVVASIAKLFVRPSAKA